MTTAAPSTPHPAAAYHARRRAEVDEKILGSARKLMLEHGVDHLTVEGVAADSGVAKTTIYRRYKKARDLAVAAAGLTTEEAKELAGVAVLAVLDAIAAGRADNRFAGVESAAFATDIALALGASREVD